jgi:hypothetical protein
MHTLVVAGEKCQRLMAARIANVRVKDVQADEIWTYVKKKESRRVLGDKDYHDIGDAWCFIAIEWNIKLVLAYHLDRRNTMAAWRFMRKLAAATSNEQRFQLTTDDSLRTTMRWAPNWMSV